MAQSVFEQLGGFLAVSGIVMDFYDRVLDSDIVGDFFVGIDMPQMVDHQTKFVASLLGGPASYTDQQLLRTHQHLDINNEHFNEICQILDQTLEDKGIGPDERRFVAQEFEKRRPYIVGH